MGKHLHDSKLLWAKKNFPYGIKVCNIKLGSIGMVVADPGMRLGDGKIFVMVHYNNDKCLEDIDHLVASDWSSDV